MTSCIPYIPRLHSTTTSTTRSRCVSPTTPTRTVPTRASPPSTLTGPRTPLTSRAAPASAPMRPLPCLALPHPVPCTGSVADVRHLSLQGLLSSHSNRRPHESTRNLPWVRPHSVRPLQQDIHLKDVYVSCCLDIGRIVADGITDVLKNSLSDVALLSDRRNVDELG